MMASTRNCFVWATTVAAGVLLWGCSDEGSGNNDTDSDSKGIETEIGDDDDDDDDDDDVEPTGGTADGSTGPDFNCGESDFDLEAVPSKVVLVLDKSASMVNNTWDHDEDPGTDEVTRWFGLHQTVDSITSTFDASIEFGVVLYPSLEATSEYTEEACLVGDAPDVEVALGNGQAVLDAIPAADAGDDVIGGGTPARAAIDVALAHLQGFDAGQVRAILYVTDGEANCQEEFEDVTELFEVYDSALETLVGDAFDSDEIGTYVVGIDIRDEVLGDDLDGAPDGINPSDELDDLAEAGGFPREGDGKKYFSTNSQLELEEALAAIVGQAFTCQVPLDSEPMHPDFVEIEIGGETIDRVDDCDSEDGWVWVNPDGPFDTIELCGAACDALAQSGSVHTTFGCPPAD